MPRDNSGNYTLPAGNPVAANTVIETAWANPTMSDMATTLTQSLDRSGRGTMLAALKLIDGTQAQPAMTWNSEASSGWYRAGAHDIRFSLGGVDQIQVTDSGVSFPGTTAYLANDGTAALPSYAFRSDPNTGMFSAGADIIGWSTGGVERARLTNVGGVAFLIGLSTAMTATPGLGALEVAGSGSANLALGVGTTLTARLYADANATNLSTATAKPLLLSTNATERMRLTPCTTGGLSELLVGMTATTMGASGRGLVEINGATGSQAVLAFDINAVLQHYLYATAGNLTFVSVNGGLAFNTASAVQAQIDSSGVFTYGGIEVGWRSMPALAKGVYTIVPATDRGKCVVATGNVTTQAGFAAGDVVSICNKSGGNITLTPTGITLNWGTGTPATGARTLANNALVTLYFTTANVATLTGAGIS